MQAAMYDTLLSGAAGATAAEQEMLRAVRAQASNWRLRKRFDSAEGADAYRKATAFEALVSLLACACIYRGATAGKIQRQLLTHLSRSMCCGNSKSWDHTCCGGQRGHAQ
jgi:hypothetical protein